MDYQKFRPEVQSKVVKALQVLAALKPGAPSGGLSLKPMDWGAKEATYWGVPAGALACRADRKTRIIVARRPGGVYEVARIMKRSNHLFGSEA